MHQKNPKLAIEKFDPAVHDLPNNRHTRQALKSLEKRRARQATRAQGRIAFHVKQVLAEYVGRPFTPEVRGELLLKLRWRLGGLVTREALEAGLDEALKESTGAPTMPAGAGDGR